jgi:hypothetical protein
MKTTKEIAPTHGYKLSKWGITCYRSTALAYLKREGLNSVQNINGSWYSLTDIESAIIGNNK